MKKKNSNKNTTILIIKISNRKLVGIFFNVGVIPIIFQSYIILNIQKTNERKKKSHKHLQTKWKHI